MQVKKFEASSVIDALNEVKQELGPDAIILSTQEVKGRTAQKKFVVVAAVTEAQYQKKKIAEKQMGEMFENKVAPQSASKQKMFIENVYRGIEKKHEARQRKITQTPYIDIGDGDSSDTAGASAVTQAQAPEASSLTRVKQAAQEAFKTSLTSQFFKEEPKEELLPDDVLRVLTQKPKIENGPLVHMTERLKKCGISNDIMNSMLEKAERELGPGVSRKALVDSWFAKQILNMISVQPEGVESGIEFFIGPHGSGKTTTLIKLATHYVVESHKSVAILTTDLNKVGAVEQLRVYSRILNVPVITCKDFSEVSAHMANLKNFDKVLVDTPGISVGNIDELDFVRSIANFDDQKDHQVHLVISALTKESDLGGLLKRFQVAGLHDIIVTNIDQTTQHGILVNIQSKVDLAFHSFGIGSDVVDGFEMASRERVLDLVFKLTNQIGERGYDSRI